ncbi:MAG: peptidylprolyl isomerase [Gordonibacter sp.]|uniref:FKBP-type peptidyl-prolyl cis-trans isomerase n=1 Tax=Gordonibacter sp. TaxID=1968902 RepID=UPI002FCC48D4
MVEIGQKVQVRFSGVLDDGTEFDSSLKRGEPFEFVVGSRSLLPAFEKAVCDMSPGEKRSVRVAASEAYGDYDESLVQTVGVSDIQEGYRLVVGSRIAMSTPMGSLQARVVGVDGVSVDLDFNHELAGKDLSFSIELVAFAQESAIEREMHPVGCACGCDRLKRSLVS